MHNIKALFQEGVSSSKKKAGKPSTGVTSHRAFEMVQTGCWEVVWEKYLKAYFNFKLLIIY